MPADLLMTVLLTISVDSSFLAASDFDKKMFSLLAAWMLLIDTHRRKKIAIVEEKRTGKEMKGCIKVQQQ